MADKNLETPVEELSFKEASIELEQVVRSLDSGDPELEDALARYARAVEPSLRERLTNAEQKVKVLLDTTSEVVAPDTTAATNED